MMIEQVEISSFDLRFESYRLKDKRTEMVLLASISEKGIKDPLQGVDTKDGRVLLNGFKRYRCAKRLSIGIVPYCCLATDAAEGLIELLRLSNAKKLNILEQAKLVDELQSAYHMSTADIAQLLEKSKAWVSVRSGIFNEMSQIVADKIFSGQFPAYAYLHILRPFMRLNGIKSKDIDEFVGLVAGKKLSIREIELLANGYLNGSDEFRRQIKEGAISFILNSVKGGWQKAVELTTIEQAMIRDLELIQEYMQRITFKSKDTRYKSGAFFAQANLLSGGILKQMDIFKETVKEIYDQSGKT